jgi:glycosyltransferase involved in cell wall biosynthesis
VTLVADRLNGLNGADLMGREILFALNRGGVPLTVVSLERLAAPEGDRGIGDVQWVTAPFHDPFPRRLSLRAPRRVASWLVQKARNVSRRRELAKALDGPLLVNGFSNSFILGFRDARVRGEAVLVVHDSPTKYSLPGQPPLAWAVAEMDRFTHYVFNSPRVREAWSRLGEIGRKPAVMIPNCCEEDAIARILGSDRREARRRLGWPEDRIVGVCVASLQHRKGQDLLVRALPGILARVPSALLVLVGAPGGRNGARFARSLVDEAVRAGCADRLLLTGPNENGAKCAYAADIFLLMSRSESTPITILEAMALGTPVIASNVDGIPDLLEDGRAGRLVPSEDVEALTEAFGALASDPSARAAIAAAARARYESNFSRGRVAAMYVDAVGRLVRREAWG